MPSIIKVEWKERTKADVDRFDHVCPVNGTQVKSEGADFFVFLRIRIMFSFMLGKV